MDWRCSQEVLSDAMQEMHLLTTAPFHSSLPLCFAYESQRETSDLLTSDRACTARNKPVSRRRKMEKEPKPSQQS